MPVRLCYRLTIPSSPPSLRSLSARFADRSWYNSRGALAALPPLCVLHRADAGPAVGRLQEGVYVCVCVCTESVCVRVSHCRVFSLIERRLGLREDDASHIHTNARAHTHIWQQVENADCAAAWRRVVELGPPVNLRDPKAFPCPGGDGEVHSLWYMQDGAVHPAKLHGCVALEESHARARDIVAVVPSRDQNYNDRWVACVCACVRARVCLFLSLGSLQAHARTRRAREGRARER